MRCENMSRLDELLSKDKWLEYYEFKLSQANLSKSEEKQLKEFIDKEKYVDIATAIIEGTYCFSIPKKRLVNKSGSTKKRVVYTFPSAENIILKFILYLMADLDYIFSENLYSFRKKHTVKQAFYNIINSKGIKDMYAFKVDISNYFNSINTHKLLPILKDVLKSDERLYHLLKDIITLDMSIFEGEQLPEKRGAMAGTSISTFFANIYLMDMDRYFEENNIIYARYSDDIIIFAKTLQELESYKAVLFEYFKKKNLTVNTDKEFLFERGSAWNFLGFEYNNGLIDLSDVTFNKIKAKIRRKARSIRRWALKKNVDTMKGVKVMIRVFNNKFYREVNTKELSWCKYYFPVITSAEKLRKIDEHLVQYLRYIPSGRFCKKNYNLTYEQLKKLGYRSLVNEFYKFKNNKN